MLPKAARDHAARIALMTAASAVLMLTLPGCGAPADDETPGATKDRSGDVVRIEPRRLDWHDHEAFSSRLFERDELADTFRGGEATFATGHDFRQVSVMFDAPADSPIQWRAVDARGDAGDWKRIDVTWREGIHHVGRIVLDEPTSTIDLRASTALENLYIEFSPEVTARTDAPLTSELPPAGTIDRDPNADLQTARQLEAPKSLVIPREDWGARDPDKKCGRSHNPYRMSIHHTASPSDDGGDPAARMRQMQAFHIDNRGWCDIGYHFVVSQSGKIYQGRSTEKRTGAHVGGENTGNIGISLIGNFEEQQVNSTQFNKAADIVRWVHSTYNIPLDRQKVKGHTEWPGQATSCPGANLKSRLQELLNKAGDQGGMTGSTWDVTITSKVTGLDNPYDQGSSGNIPDAFPGDGLQAEILVTNKSDEPIRDVWLGYALDGAYLTATNYKIFTDHPEHDKSTWMVNDANEAEENPAADKLGASGKLLLYAFSPGETKRIVVDLDAKRYSLGQVSHPELRGWVRQIKDVYQTKDGWSATPSTDKIGMNLRTRAEIDVLDRDQWHFNNTDTQENLEGWIGCCDGDFDRLALNHDDGLMAIDVTQKGAQLISPEWTRVDADTYDQMVLRVRAHDGEHQKAIYWTHNGESFSAERRLRFRSPGDGEFHTFIVPLGDNADWSGTISRLRIDPLFDRDPTAEGSGWYDIDGIYFRNSDGQKTTSDKLAFGDGTLVEPIDGKDADSDNDGDDNIGNPPTGDDNDDGSSSGNGSGGRTVSASENARYIQTKGCSAAGSNNPTSWFALLALLGLGALRRRHH